MYNKRIVGVACVIGVMSAAIMEAPGIILGSLFEQGPPAWLPMVGTDGQTLLLYTYGTDIIGAALMILLGVGFGYDAARYVDLRYDYPEFVKLVIIGTTVPLVLVWIVAFGGFVFGSFGGFSVVVFTSLLLYLFTSVSLPVTVAIFSGAALAHISEDYSSSAEREVESTLSASN